MTIASIDDGDQPSHTPPSHQPPFVTDTMILLVSSPLDALITSLCAVVGADDLPNESWTVSVVEVAEEVWVVSDSRDAEKSTVYARALSTTYTLDMPGASAVRLLHCSAETDPVSVLSLAGRWMRFNPTLELRVAGVGPRHTLVDTDKPDIIRAMLGEQSIVQPPPDVTKEHEVEHLLWVAKVVATGQR